MTGAMVDRLRTRLSARPVTSVIHRLVEVRSVRRFVSGHRFGDPQLTAVARHHLSARGARDASSRSPCASSPRASPLAMRCKFRRCSPVNREAAFCRSGRPVSCSTATL
jgi:hypothetical protein